MPVRRWRSTRPSPSMEKPSACPCAREVEDELLLVIGRVSSTPETSGKRDSASLSASEASLSVGASAPKNSTSSASPPGPDRQPRKLTVSASGCGSPRSCSAPRRRSWNRGAASASISSIEMPPSCSGSLVSAPDRPRPALPPTSASTNSAGCGRAPPRSSAPTASPRAASRASSPANRRAWRRAPS